MFYPIDLLSRRRRGKLAPCWLAATSNEKLFKRYYNSGTIKKIDIIETCGEILQMVPSPNSRSDRFSLYLSSQLMYGITKIHSYQIAYFEKELLEIQEKLDSTASLKKNEDEYVAFEDLEFPTIELPLLSQNFIDNQLGIDLHILPGEDPDDRLQIATSQDLMQDAACLNFGCLNNEELDFMLEHDDISFDLMRKLQISKEKDISEKIADITIAEEIQEKDLSQQICGSAFVDVSKRNNSKDRLSLTPQKRQPQMRMETPTKKRRLSFEISTMTVPPVPKDMAVPVAESVEEMRTLIPSQQMKTDIDLESLHSSYFMIDRNSNKGPIIDKKISLSDKQLKIWRQDVNIYCRQLDRPLIHHSLAKNLLKQPSLLSMRWNTKLHNVFVDRITALPFKNINEDVASEFMQFSEVRLEEPISRVNLPTEDLSTFGKIDIAPTTEPIDSVVNILPMPNITHETDVLMAPLPEVVPDMVTLEEGTSTVRHGPDQERINNTDESFEDIEILLERKRRSLKMEHTPIPSPSIMPSPPALISREIWTLLEVLWSDKDMIKFEELVPTDTYTKEDAATVFEILLEFYAQKKLTLQQIDFTHPLWILKHKD